MAFDALHIIWTTHHYWQPHDVRGEWFALHELYEQLSADGHYYELSAEVPKSIAKAPCSGLVELMPHERAELEKYLFELAAPNGDRIAGGLPIDCCAISPTAVQLLLVPALPDHNQIIGRLKSKTASHLLRSDERKSQKRIWSSSYWFANINGAEAIAKVARFIRKQRNDSQ